MVTEDKTVYDRSCLNCKSYTLGTVVQQVGVFYLPLVVNAPTCVHTAVQRLWIAANIPREYQGKLLNHLPVPLSADAAGPICRSRFWQERVVEAVEAKVNAGV